jgi:hypothetical protein
MMREDLMKIRQLQALAELKLTTELAQLKVISDEEAAPKAAISAIAQEKTRNASDASLGVSQSTIAGMDNKWSIWAEREQRDAMRALARIAQRREDQLIVTKQAFGRTEALKNIAIKMRNDAKT